MTSHFKAATLAMLAVFQIPCNDGSEDRIVEESVCQRIEERCEMADACTPKHASGTKRAMRLAETGKPLFPFHQMIKRA